MILIGAGVIGVELVSWLSWLPMLLYSNGEIGIGMEAVGCYGNSSRIFTSHRGGWY